MSLAADVFPDVGHSHIVPYLTHVRPLALVSLFGPLADHSWDTLLPLFLFLDKLEEMVRKLWTTSF